MLRGGFAPLHADAIVVDGHTDHIPNAASGRLATPHTR